MPSVRDFEDDVFSLESVRIIVRADKRQAVDDYDYEKRAATGTTVSEWLETRVMPRLKGLDVVVIDGNGEIVRGSKKMGTVRETFDA